jgi:hypothetical protein
LYPIGKLKTICPVHIYGVSQLWPLTSNCW